MKAVGAWMHGASFLAMLLAAVAEVESSSTFAMLHCVVRHPQNILFAQRCKKKGCIMCPGLYCFLPT